MSDTPEKKPFSDFKLPPQPPASDYSQFQGELPTYRAEFTGTLVKGGGWPSMVRRFHALAAALPSETGKVRYYTSTPPGFYEEIPCTCKPECPDPCRGSECGCRACSAAYHDAIDYD